MSITYYWYKVNKLDLSPKNLIKKKLLRLPFEEHLYTKKNYYLNVSESSHLNFGILCISFEHFIFVFFGMMWWFKLSASWQKCKQVSMTQLGNTTLQRGVGVKLFLKSNFIYVMTFLSLSRYFYYITIK